MPAPMFSKLKCRPLVINSHPRSGTHALIDFIRRQLVECQSWKKRGESFNRMYLSVESLYISGTHRTSLPKAVDILNRVERPLIKTHLPLKELIEGKIDSLEAAAPGFMEWLLENADFYHVYRDGRSVMMSHQLLVEETDPKAGHSMGEFMHQQVDNVSRPRYWAEFVESALGIKQVFNVQFEKLLSDPKGTIETIAKQSSLTPIFKEPLLAKPLKNYWMGRYQRLFSTCPQSTAIIGRLKRKNVEKWYNTFTAEDRSYFHQEAGETLIKLGYEDSEDWVNNSGK